MNQGDGQQGHGGKCPVGSEKEAHGGSGHGQGGGKCTAPSQKETHDGHGHGAGQCPSTPQTTVENDPAAKELLRGAFEKTSRWGAAFRGFSADFICNDNGTEYKGAVRVKSPKETEVSLSGAPEALQQWAQNQISMMAVHRASRAFEEADGKYPITFAPEEGSHPLGRQIIINGDGMGSRYRIKDERIQQISRAMGRMKFTINVQEAMKTEDGKFLTTQYVVYYFSPDGAITQVESFTDHPVVIDGVYLPCHRRIILTEGGEVTARLLQFKNHAWL